MAIRHRLGSLGGAALLSMLLLDTGSTAAQSNLSVTHLSTFHTGIFGQAGAESIAFDPGSRRAFFNNAALNAVVILDLTDPSSPAQVGSVSMSPFGATVSSVAFSNGLIAATVRAAAVSTRGRVVFMSTEGVVRNSIEVGVTPGMVVFTHGGAKAIVANEGEPSSDYLTDPEGSVSIVDLSNGPESAPVTTVGFTAFNRGGPRANELPSTVRIFGPGASVAQDLEPEYVAVTDDGEKAYVTLQENNAVAVIDVDGGRVESIFGLGFKDHSLPEFGLDASDRDGIINIRTWPVKGMFQPDAISVLSAPGHVYFLTANEGDARDYAGFNEERRVGDLNLDAAAFPDPALRQDANLGRLTATPLGADAGGDGDVDVIQTFGGRSFSVWDGETGELVFDSGDQLEQVTATAYRESFNSASQANNSFDSRSDDKGPEPEALAVGTIGLHTFAFVGLEGIGGVAVFDISTPDQPRFVTYFNNRDFGVAFDPDAITPNQLTAVGDLGIATIVFVKPAESPNGQAMLITANDVSGSVSVFSLALDDAVVAVSDVPLDGLGDHLQSVETNLGNLLADAFLWQARQVAGNLGLDQPDVAFVAAGGIRSDEVYPAGDLSEFTASEILPLGYTVSIVPSIPPSQFKELAENAVSRVGSGAGTDRFAQIAGFKMIWDPGGQAQELDETGLVVVPGNRIQTIVLDDGTAVVENGVLVNGAPDVSVVVGDSLAIGAYQYPFREAAFTRIGVSDLQALGRYLADGLGGVISATDYPDGGEGRIEQGFETSVEVDNQLPRDLRLESNYPNPFNPRTTIRFGLPEAGNVVLSVYDVAGRLIKRILDEPFPAGWHHVEFSADLPTGIYLYRIEAGGSVRTGAMHLVK